MFYFYNKEKKCFKFKRVSPHLEPSICLRAGMRRWVILKGEGGDSWALTRAAFEGEGQALDRVRTDELCWSSNRKRWRWQPTGQNPAAKAGNNVAAANRLQGQPDPSHPLRPLANAPASSRLLPLPIGPLKLIGFPGARPFGGLREVARSLPHFRRGSHAESGRRGRVGPLALYYSHRRILPVFLRRAV